MSHVFISYAHSDNDFVELMRIKINEAGIQPWIDHSNLKAGSDWRITIDDAIKSSASVLLVISPDSMGSHYVTYEWSFAQGLGKPLIPVMYRTATLHAKLLTLQYLDFTHRILRPWDELIQHLKTVTS